MLFVIVQGVPKLGILLVQMSLAPSKIRVCLETFGQLQHDGPSLFSKLIEKLPRKMNLKSVNPSKNVEQFKIFGYIHNKIFETFCACYPPAHTITIRPFYANVEVLQYNTNTTPTHTWHGSCDYGCTSEKLIYKIHCKSKSVENK